MVVVNLYVSMRCHSMGGCVKLHTLNKNHNFSIKKAVQIICHVRFMALPIQGRCNVLYKVCPRIQ
jgi:hypothetical protein